MGINCLFIPFAHFPIGLDIIFNFNWLISVLYIVSIPSHDLLCIPNFSQSVICLLTLLRVIFCETELLNLDAVKLTNLCRNQDFLNQMWGQWTSRWKLAALRSRARYLIFLHLQVLMMAACEPREANGILKIFFFFLPALLFLPKLLHLPGLRATWGQHYILLIPWTSDTELSAQLHL